MCGISGEIRFDGDRVDRARLERMNRVMEKRGPDDEGIHIEGPRGFGHRRLRIMDLSDLSAQPMVADDLGVGIVFNGAVYNYPDLRAELETEGYRFRSTGDTEVVLKAWHRWGTESVKRLEGMFAFAIWERDSGRTFLVRDRLGIKPLYYTADPKRLRFASSLPALLAAGEISSRIDPRALNAYLSFHSVVPAPRTILLDVRKLEPGHIMTIEPDGTESLERYWRLGFERSDADDARPFEEWREMLINELRRAVRRRLLAAVDVGVLLSGGVDSSLLVGLMAEAGMGAINTYSVGFESVGGIQGDEFRYSDIVVDRFKTHHHKIPVPSTELLDRLPEAIRAMSEPMVSHDCIGFFLLSHEVSRTCKAVQSGQGADEVFGGYHWYPPMRGSRDPFATYKRAFFDRDFDEYRQVVDPSMVDGDFASAFVREHFQTPGAEDPVDKALRIDTTVMLVDDPVKRVDNMTMAWGLEARVPFLDHHLVEFAARIPGRHKVAGDGKHILKEAARSVIPAEVIDRPKGYFPVPALTYLRGRVLEFVREAVAGPRARSRGIYNSRYVEQLLAAPEDHITPLKGSKLWQLGLLELWLEAQGV